MKYRELIAQQQTEINNFPLFFAFNHHQLKNGLEKLGVKADELTEFSPGGFMIKKDKKAFTDLIDRHAKEKQYFTDSDKDGSGFIKEMFADKLSDHEYCYTRDLNEIFYVLGLTIEEVENNKALSNGLREQNFFS